MVMLAIEGGRCFHFNLMSPGTGNVLSDRYLNEKLGLPLDVAREIAEFLNLVRGD